MPFFSHSHSQPANVSFARAIIKSSQQIVCRFTFKLLLKLDWCSCFCFLLFALMMVCGWNKEKLIFEFVTKVVLTVLLCLLDTFFFLKYKRVINWFKICSTVKKKISAQIAFISITLQARTSQFMLCKAQRANYRCGEKRRIFAHKNVCKS
jgi:hypothetical protein